MVIKIEIGKSYVSDRWRIRVGDIDGSTESSGIPKKELLKEIKDAIEEEDDGHDSNCEGSMCYCSGRLRRAKKQRAETSNTKINSEVEDAN